MLNVVYLHIVCAFSGIFLLLVRGLMQLNGKNWRAIKPLRILPHLVDTLLIISGFILIFGTGYGFPLWIILKFLLLAAYVTCSAKFFSKNAIESNNIFFFIAALSAFVGIMLIAYFH